MKSSLSTSHESDLQIAKVSLSQSSKDKKAMTIFARCILTRSMFGLQTFTNCSLLPSLCAIRHEYVMKSSGESSVVISFAEASSVIVSRLKFGTDC